MKHLSVFIASACAFACATVLDASAQWMQTGGASPGDVICFGSHGTTLFAGVYDRDSTNGVFRSTDDGATWIAANNGIPSTPAVWDFIATGNSLLAASTRFGVYVSTDDGATWTASNAGLTSPVAMSFAVIGTNLFVGTEVGGVFISSNSGALWSPVNAGLTDDTVLVLMARGTDLFAGTTNGMFHSTDLGQHWTFAGLAGMYVFKIAAVGTTLFALNQISDGGFFRSTDDGANWTPLINAEVLGLAVSGTNLFAGSKSLGVYLSSDLGAHWNPVTTGLTKDIRSIALMGRNLYAGTFGNGIWRRPVSEMASDVQRSPIAQPVTPELSIVAQPNPARDELQLTYTVRGTKSTIDFVNTLGECVLHVHGNESGDTYLNIRHLPAGMYTVQLHCGAAMAAQRVMIVK